MIPPETRFVGGAGEARSSLDWETSRIGNAMPVPPNPSVIRCASPDADELCFAARAWDLDFRPLQRAPGASRLVQTIDSAASLGYARLAPRVEQRGASPRGMRTFALLGRDAPCVIWCGATVDSETLMSFDSGGDFECSSPAGFAVHTLSVSIEALDGLARIQGLGSVERLECSARTIRLLPGQADGLRRSLEEVTRRVECDPVAAGRPGVRERVEQQLPAALLRAAIEDSLSPQAGDTSTRERSLRRALEFIEANARRAPRVAELSAASGTSERTLRYAFQERFGLSPKEYLQAVRLNGVRRDLRHPRDRATISDTANRWGFWHMGQFAADYRRLFGELPSQTVASCLRSKSAPPRAASESGAWASSHRPDPDGFGSRRASRT
jgi:AraC-like DNA-binding protein